MPRDTGEVVKNVGIWIRVSTEDQVRGESPEHHEARARQYASLKGWNVAEVYRLDALSGKSVMAYAETKRMLADVRSGAITGLVFSKLARLARNTKELLDFADVFRACDADMISLAESIDTSTPAGRLFFTMIAAVAQWEREEIVERVRASVPIRAKLGKPTGGAAPFGYQWVDKKLVVQPDEAAIRTLLYELFAEHQRKKTVARLLNERGYRTRGGNRFTDATVGRLLEDPTAKGLHRSNYTQGRDKASHTALKPEAEWVWNEVEPIVSEELWERCNGLLALRATGRRPAKQTTYLFSGVAHCECGSKMYVPARRNKYVCPKCANKIPVDDLEEVFRSRLVGYLLSPEEQSEHKAAASEALREKDRLIETAEGELKKLERAEQELLDLYHSGQVKRADFGRLHQPMSERRSQLDEELPRLLAERDVLKIGILSQEVTTQEARDLHESWSEFSFEKRRQLVQDITDRVTIGKESVDVTLLELLPFGEAAQKATDPRLFCRWARRLSSA